MRWAKCVVRRGGDMQTRFWLENMKELGGLEDQEVDGWIILKWLL